MKKTLIEKIDLIKELENKGFKTYLRIRPGLSEKEIINEETDNITDVIRDEEINEVIRKNLLPGLIDITDLEFPQQIETYHNRLLKALNDLSPVELQVIKDDPYWELRDIGNNDGFKGNPMSLQYCLGHNDAIAVAELLMA